MRINLLLLVALLALAGCGGPEKQLLGKWQFDVSSMPKSGNAQTDAMMGQAFQGLSLEFKPGGTFSMVANGQSMDGTDTINDHTVSMTITKMPGSTTLASGNNTFTATLSADGKQLAVSKTAGARTMSFIKAP